MSGDILNYHLSTQTLHHLPQQKQVIKLLSHLITQPAYKNYIRNLDFKFLFVGQSLVLYRFNLVHLIFIIHRFNSKNTNYHVLWICKTCAHLPLNLLLATLDIQIIDSIWTCTIFKPLHCESYMTSAFNSTAYQDKKASMTYF